MMQDDLVRSLHASPHRGVVALSGGGSGAIQRLLSTAGASSTVLEAVVPYSQAALADWLGRPPERACDEATARLMAMRAFERARRLDAPGGDPRELFGVGCTASLASTRPKRGEHRAHVAVQTWKQTRLLTLGFEKGRRTRLEEEQATAHGVVATLAAAVGLHAIDLDKSPPGIEAAIEVETAPPAWGELLLGERRAVAVGGAPPPGAGAICLFPGSFNPPHVGHERIAQVAAERTGRPVVLELSIANVDKPPLDFLEIRRRLATLSDAPAWLTGAPTFVEKAELSPAVVFAVGADTIERIADPRYYGGPAARDAAVDRLAELAAGFLVFGRVADGRFVGLDALDLPPALRDLCESVPESDFREDVSSTELREA